MNERRGFFTVIIAVVLSVAAGATGLIERSALLFFHGIPSYRRNLNNLYRYFLMCFSYCCDVFDNILRS